MPGISQRTYIAIQQIKTFPKDEQEIASDIYSKMENIEILQWLPLVISLIITTTAQIFLTSQFGWLLSVICICLWPVGFLACYKFSKWLFVDWLIYREVDKINFLIEMDDHGEAALQSLIRANRRVERIAKKYYIS